MIIAGTSNFVQDCVRCEVFFSNQYNIHCHILPGQQFRQNNHKYMNNFINSKKNIIIYVCLLTYCDEWVYNKTYDSMI